MKFFRINLDTYESEMLLKPAHTSSRFSYSSGSARYRWGFNGMEKDDNLKGTGNSYDFGARIYDSRIGRFNSEDPLAKQYPFMSPYTFSANNPIRFIDKNGEGPGDPPYLTGDDGFDNQLELVYQTYGDQNSYTINYTYHNEVDENGFVISKGGAIIVVDNEQKVVFSYAHGDMIENSDANKNTNGDLILRGVQSVNEYGAYTLIQGENARNYYNENVKHLGPTDGKARSKYKIRARAKTPAIPATIIEAKKPITDELSRQTGTANKTNAKYNRNAKILGKFGRGLGVLSFVTAGINISTAEDKSRAAAEEVGGFAGALAGGEAGALIGASIGAPFAGVGAVPGAIIGGIVGSIVGGFVGAEYGAETHDKVEAIIDNTNTKE